MTTAILYLLAAAATAASYFADRARTVQALRKAKASLLNILPEFSVVLGLVGIMLTFLSPALIQRYIGAGSGVPGLLAASVVGSITLIPGFVAFPLAASLLARGAGPTHIALFVSTLMMVGVLTFPLERRYFGRREAILRNGLAYVFSFVVALIVGAVVGR
ncbi:MAG: permease [Bacillota bacterium]|nr:permease [Bacillota bacterium]